MSLAVLARVLGAIWPPRPEERVLVAGLDAAGKTSLLYRLKMGELIQTIPTIGFNVETVVIPELPTYWTIWDVGGCDRIRPLLRHYLQNTSALVWIVDSRDRSRLGESMEELQYMLRAIQGELERASIPLDRFLGVAVVANKQDLEAVISVKGIEAAVREASESEAKGIPIKVFGASVTANEGLLLPFQWLESRRVALHQAPKAKSTEGQSTWFATLASIVSPQSIDSGNTNIALSAMPVSTDVEIPLPPAAAELMQKIRATQDVPTSSAAFLESFAEGNVQPFDHRAHLRAAFLLLLRARRNGRGDFVAINDFMAHLRLFIVRAGNKVRNTFHVTMTTFWCCQMQQAMSMFATKHRRQPTTEDFENTLLCSPFVTWKVMMSKDAASRFIMPDKKPFLQYSALRESAVSFANVSMATAPGASNFHPNQVDAPTAQLERHFALWSKEKHWHEEEDKLWLAFGQISKDFVLDEDLCDFLTYTAIRRSVEHGVRRGEAVNDLFRLLESHREFHASVTHVYARIQVFSAMLQGWRLLEAESVKNSGGVQQLHLPSHKLALLLYPDLFKKDFWKGFYSETVWTSPLASTEFVLPDLAPFPTTLDIASLRHDSERLHASFERANFERQSASELTLWVDTVLLQSELDDRETRSETEVLLTRDAFINAVESGSVAPLNHARILRYMFLQLTKKDSGEAQATAATRIINGIDSHYRHTYNKPPLTEASDLRGPLVPIPTHPGVTMSFFWIQRILGALAADAKNDEPFDAFIHRNAILTDPDLWRLNYSERVFSSVEGLAVFVPPDLQKFASYV
ncbi:ADP-ribosylation factor family-domain-containing protein [Zopfochytrium polystomum]|nr:ADP-ribosylation factor family-domain-containing protein [Zopfochytrium polystomum]